MRYQQNLTSRNISWFIDAFTQERLVIKPPYQRNPVWSERQKSYLIDSVLNGFPIPEVYIKETINDDGSTIHELIDGQQRIRACLDFYENKFEIHEEDSDNYAGFSFSDLTNDQKKVFYGYNFVVRVVPDVTEEEIRSIFKRLNKNNVALNRQELRQATYWGEFITTMNEISGYEEWSEIGIFSSNDVRRMLDVEFISELAVASLHGVQNKKIKLDDYYLAYEEEFPESQNLKKTFKVLTTFLIDSLPNIRRTRWKNKNDFYTLFVLLSKVEDQLTLSDQKKIIFVTKLTDFAQRVSEYVSTARLNQTSVSSDPNVSFYAKALRASTDLGSRKSREVALATELRDIFNFGNLVGS